MSTTTLDNRPTEPLQQRSRALGHSSNRVLSAFRSVGPAVAALPSAVADYDGLIDDEVLEVQREIISLRRILDARSALVAAQLVRRSAPELGSSGLAQRGGFRTPEELVRVTTGSTAGAARTAVRVGVILDETQRGGRVDQVTGELYEPARPWLAVLADAVASGDISVTAVESIRSGLGEPGLGVTAAMLTDAVGSLLNDAQVLDADRLYRRARDIRDELDASGIAAREEERRAARALRLHRRPDGSGRLVWDMDPETLAVVGETYDQLTSPRRGGPRFVDAGGTGGDSGASERQRTERILADARSTEQLASDGFLDLLRIAVETAPTAVIGLRRPSVRVLVTERTLSTRAGHGRLEGHPDPVSIGTVERFACTDGIVPITIDNGGQALDVGREQRLYTRRQRIALAARDGGCRWPGCERPPAWTEAHHIQHWARDHGSTNVADGILLCRHHHLLSHNNGWEITRSSSKGGSGIASSGDYWLIPPPNIDPHQHPIAMPTKSPALRDALREL
jgi:hypothetical protein